MCIGTELSLTGAISLSVLLLELSTVLGGNVLCIFILYFNVFVGNRNPYTRSLESWSDLTPGPPYGSFLDCKIADFVRLSHFIPFLTPLDVF